MNIKFDNDTGALLGSRLGCLLRPCLRFLELLVVDCHAKLLRHETSEIDRETEGIIKSPNVLAVQCVGSILPLASNIRFKELLPSIQRARKRFLFFIQNFFEVCGALGNFRESISL